MSGRDALISSLVLGAVLACGPGNGQGTDGGTIDVGGTSGDAGMSGADGAVTTDVPTTEGSSGGPSALCVVDPEVLARFHFELDGWPLNDNGAFVIDAPCELAAILPSSEIPVELMLQCTDPVGMLHAVELLVAKFPVARLPMQEGQALMLHLRTAPGAALDRGAWTLRDSEGGLLLAGYRGEASLPEDPDFVAPLIVRVDAERCPASALGGCSDVQPLVLAFDLDGEALPVGHGQHGVLPGGFDAIVERALQVNGDPALCSDEYTGPEPFQFMIVGS